MTGLEPMMGRAFGLGLELALRASVLLAGALLLGLLLRRSSGAARHALWSVALASLVGLPLLGFVLPALPVGDRGMWGNWGDALVVKHARVVEGVGSDASVTGGWTEPGGDIARGAARGVGRVDPSGPGADDDRAETLSAGGNDGIAVAGGGAAVWRGVFAALRGMLGPGTRPGALLVWLVGFAMVAGGLGVGLARAGRVVRRAVLEEDDEWQAGLRGAADRAGVQRRVTLRIGPGVPTPMTGGLLRPVILLPEEARRWPAERRDLVLLHEMVHIRRGDALRQIIARLALALYWYHPLVWLVARMAAFAREQACDEAVISLGHRPSTYARHLLEVADRHTLPIPALARLERPQLERRLMAILRSDSNPRRRGAALLAGVCMTMWALAVSAAELAGTAAMEGQAQVRPDGPVPAGSPEMSSLASAPSTGPRGSETVSPAAPASDLSAAAMAFPAPARAPGATIQQSGECWVNGRLDGFRGTTSISRSESGDRLVEVYGYQDGDRVIQTRLNDVMLCMRVQGDVVFDAGGGRIERLGQGARVVMAARAPHGAQSMVIVPGAAGPEHTWSVNGTSQAFDAAATEWRDAMLPVLNGHWEASRIRGEVSSLRGEISSIRGQQSSLRGEISSIRGQVSSLNGQISSVRGQESSLRGEISSIRGHESSLRGQVSSVRGHESSLRGQISSLRGRISSLESAHRATGDAETRSRLAAEIAAVESSIREVEREIARYGADARVATIEQEIAAYDVARRVADVEARIRTLDTDGRVRTIEAQIAAYGADARVRAVESQIDGLNVEGRVRGIEAQIDALDADRRVSEIRSRLDGQERQLRDVIGRIR